MAFLGTFLPVQGGWGGEGREVAIQEHSSEFYKGIFDLRAKFVVIQILAVSIVKKSRGK